MALLLIYLTLNVEWLNTIVGMLGSRSKPIIIWHCWNNWKGNWWPQTKAFYKTHSSLAPVDICFPWLSDVAGSPEPLLSICREGCGRWRCINKSVGPCSSIRNIHALPCQILVAQQHGVESLSCSKAQCGHRPYSGHLHLCPTWKRGMLMTTFASSPFTPFLPPSLSLQETSETECEREIPGVPRTWAQPPCFVPRLPCSPFAIVSMSHDSFFWMSLNRNLSNKVWPHENHPMLQCFDTRCLCFVGRGAVLPSIHLGSHSPPWSYFWASKWSVQESPTTYWRTRAANPPTRCAMFYVLGATMVPL